MVIFQYNLYIFGIHLWTVLYPKPCYNEPCCKEIVVYFVCFSQKIGFDLSCKFWAGLGGSVWCALNCRSCDHGFDPRRVRQHFFVEIGVQRNKQEVRVFSIGRNWEKYAMCGHSPLLYPRHTKYVRVSVYSFLLFHSSICLFVRTFVRLSFRHRVKVFALKFIRLHILKTLWWISFLFGMMVDIGLKFISAPSLPRGWPWG